MSNLTAIIDGSAGSAQHSVGTTVQTFALSLAAGAVLFGVQFTGFVIFRNYLWAKRIYQPRSFLVPLKSRVKPPPNNVFRWIKLIFTIPSSTEVLSKAGMDAYFFLRYLLMGLKLFFPIALFTLPILIPLNTVNGRDRSTINGTQYNVTGLDKLAWGNVPPDHTNRYWAHLILAIGVIAWACFLFHHELTNYIVKRQKHLGSPSHRLKASSTTVLITDIPPELCTVEALTEIYDDFPGGVRRMWINKNYEMLVEKDQLRRETEDVLEKAETDLLRKATKKSRKSKKIMEDAAKTTPSSTDFVDQSKFKDAIANRESQTSDSSSKETGAPMSATASDCESDLRHDIETHAAWTRYIQPREREKMRIPDPRHKAAFKIPMIGRFFGQKVDTIYYCRRKLACLNQQIEDEINRLDTRPSNGSAFIQFNTQKAAHLACQAIADTKPRKMSQRTVEISPADINWAALDQHWFQRIVRLLLFLLLMFIFVLVLGLISFVTGIISRIAGLSASTSWLRWISALPPWLLSFIQGTLPPVIQIIILSGPTPIVLRSMTNSTRAAITGSQGERSLQNWYFILLLLELFIIPTISAGLTSTIRALIQDAGSVPTVLATYLPSAANYYFSFLVVQALSISASSIFQTVRMFKYFVLGGVKTPDALFVKLTSTHLTRIGSNIPWYTTFIVVGLVYSVIAPLMSVFLLFTFSLFWIVIKNNVLYVVRTGVVDSGALWFPGAIAQTFVGLYFMEVCLIGLFFLVEDIHGHLSCQAQGTIMAVCLVLTIIYQIWLVNNFSGLVKYAPLRLETMAAQQDKEYEVERLAPHTVIHDTEKDESSRGKKPIFHSPDRMTLSLSKELSPPTVNTSHPGRRSSALTMAIADRSHDMQMQKEHDAQQAKHILSRLNRPLDETRLKALETHLTAVEGKIGNVLLPRSKDIEARMLNDPVSKVIMQHNDELEDLTPEERDMLISVAFTHPVIRDSKPAIWIPQDNLGISDDEVARTRALSKHLVIDNRGAFFNKKLKLEIDRAPPDMSEFALVMAEL